MSATPTTDQDYTRDLAADLAIQQAATPGPWGVEGIDAGRLGIWQMPTTDPDGTIWRSAQIMPWMGWERGTGHATYIREHDARAIANAGTHAQGWLRRAMAAEEAILEWAVHYEDPRWQDINRLPEICREGDKIDEKLTALAARILEGRSHA